MKYLQLFEGNWWDDSPEPDKKIDDDDPFGEDTISTENKYTVRDYYNLLKEMVGINFVEISTEEESDSLWFGVNYPGTLSYHTGEQKTGRLLYWLFYENDNSDNKIVMYCGSNFHLSEDDDLNGNYNIVELTECTEDYMIEKIQQAANAAPHYTVEPFLTHLPALPVDR